MINKAKNLAKYTSELAAGPYWEVDDQDTLLWLISQAEEVKSLREQNLRLRKAIKKSNKKLKKGIDSNLIKVYIVIKE